MPTQRWTRVGIALAISLVPLSLLMVWAPLDGDVRYEIGSQTASPESAAGTFTHRPLTYRLIMSVLIWPAEQVSRGVPSFELGMRLEALALAGAAGALLWAGLRRWWPELALPLATAVTAAGIFIGPAILLEPEWFALQATIAGVGAGLVARSRWVSGVLAGVLLMVAATIKMVSLPIAVIGLIALLLIDRPRCLIAAGSATVAGLLWLGGVALWAPWEFQWMIDTSLMVPDRSADAIFEGSRRMLGNAAIMWPAVTILPAALVGAPRAHVLGALAAVVLAWVPVSVQNQFFIYHLAALPVVAAVCLFGAVRRNGWALAVPVVVVSAAALWVLTSPAAWRAAHQPQLFLVAGVVAAGALVCQWLPLRTAVPSPAAAACLGVVTVLAASLPASSPQAAESVTLSNNRLTPLSNRAATARQITNMGKIRARIGADTPVTYLTFGTAPYMLRNPTPCEIPTNVFLQRSRNIRRQEGSPTWNANLRCLTDKPGEWVVWDQNWFLLRRQPEPVKAVILETFDCDQGFKVSYLTVCPRRS